MTPQVRPDHLFACSDGCLYDTRVPNWHELPPLRANYCHTHTEINSAADLKATLRNGAYQWPGGYPMYFHDHAGEACSFDGVKADLAAHLRAFMHDDHWSRCDRLIGTAVNWEDNELTCILTNEPIESAYGEHDTPPEV